MKSTAPTMSMLDLLEEEDRGSLRSRRLFGRVYLVDKRDQKVMLCPCCGVRKLDGAYSKKEHKGWTVCTSCSYRLAKVGAWSAPAYVCTTCGSDYTLDRARDVVSVGPDNKVSVTSPKSPFMTSPLCQTCEWEIEDAHTFECDTCGDDYDDRDGQHVCEHQDEEE